MPVVLSVAIEAIWEKSRGEVARRIQTLEEMISAVLADDLQEDLRARAERDAHKLAGSLGMFGFPTGSALAREVEQTLATEGGPPSRARPAWPSSSSRCETSSTPAPPPARTMQPASRPPTAPRCCSWDRTPP